MSRVLALIRSDYDAWADLRRDGPRRRRLLMLPRMLLNPSMHAVVLVRLANGAPRWSHWLWRNILIWKHSMDIVHRSDIGPGLILPHPFNIAIAPGVRVGRRVIITHSVSLGPNFRDGGMPRVGDNTVLLTNSGLFGGIEVGEGCIIGSGCFVDFDVPAGSIVRAPRATVVEERARELLKDAAHIA